MGTTANYAFPYPEASDAANGPTQIAALAAALDTRRTSDKICAAFLRATSTTALTTANTNYPVAFNTEDLDTGNGHDNVTNNTRYTVPAGRGGVFAILGGYGITPSGSGPWLIIAALYKNGTVISGSAGRASHTVTNLFTVSTRLMLITLAAGDYIELGAQCSVASQTTDTSASSQASLALARLMD